MKILTVITNNLRRASEIASFLKVLVEIIEFASDKMQKLKKDKPETTGPDEEK